MTLHDKDRFKAAFNRLAVATRLPADQADSSAQKVYFLGLEDLAIDAVEMAARELEKNAAWFPKVAEWREAAKLQKRVLMLKALPPPREEPWHHDCELCEDGGWEPRVCYPGTQVTCGRKRCASNIHPEHRYVTACTCRATNRTYLRHRAATFGAVNAA